MRVQSVFIWQKQCQSHAHEVGNIAAIAIYWGKSAPAISLQVRGIFEWNPTSKYNQDVYWVVCLLWVLLYAVNVHAEYECDRIRHHHDIASVNGFLQRVATWFTGGTIIIIIIIKTYYCYIVRLYNDYIIDRCPGSWRTTRSYLSLCDIGSGRLRAVVACAKVPFASVATR
jgi:hypothetical protein